MRWRGGSSAGANTTDVDRTRLEVGVRGWLENRDGHRPALGSSARRRRPSCGRAVLGLGEQQLHVADPPLGEAGLAVAEIERPQSTEALVVAERRELLDVAHEVRAPPSQRLDVVG